MGPNRASLANALSGLGRSDSVGFAQRLEEAKGGAGREAGPPGMGPQPQLTNYIVHQAGGDAVAELMPQGWTAFEEYYSRQPQSGWFSSNVSPDRPVIVPIASYQVPVGTDLWLRDYEFMLFRLSGNDAGDFVRLEDYRLSGCIGFDINVDTTRRGSLRFELEPQPVVVTTSTRVALAIPVPVVNAPGGLSLLPPRSNVQGARGAPWTLVCREGQTVNLVGVIFRPIRTVLACMVGRIAGFLLPKQESAALIERTRPR